MSKKLIILGAVSVLAIFILAAIFIISKTNNPADTNESSAGHNDIVPTGQAISVDGFAICLIPQDKFLVSSKDCVIGIEKPDQTDYGLIDQSGKYLDPVNFTTGSRLHMDGQLVNNSGLENKYKLAGTIQVGQ